MLTKVLALFTMCIDKENVEIPCHLNSQSLETVRAVFTKQDKSRLELRETNFRTVIQKPFYHYR